MDGKPVNEKTGMKDQKAARWEGIENLPGILSVNSRKYGSKVALSSVTGTTYTYSELEHASRHVASMLQAAGIGKGDCVAILGENSPHWVVAYFGILATGATTVPILPDFQAREIRSILEHSDARALFLSAKSLPGLDISLPPRLELLIGLEDLMPVQSESGKMPEVTGNITAERKLVPARESFPGEENLGKAGGDDLAAIIYTSGTTGKSKGVMLTHDNILSNAKQSRTIHEVVPEDRFLSMLPLAHTYEGTIGMVVPLLNGARIHYIDRPPTAAYLGPVLRELKPTTMLTVPLIIEKIFSAKIKPALYGSPVKKALMKVAPLRRIFSRVAARKLMVFFGGELRFFGVGGAPLHPEVEKFLLEGGFPYAIGYGLTETSPLVAGFSPAGATYLSVGKVLEGVTVRIDNPDPVTGEGEILVSGPNVMKGYFREPGLTADVFTPDGFFRTGDLAYRDGSGTIFIRGRLKNMILGPNGENIYPEDIEAVLNSEEIVSESLVMQSKGKLVAKVHLNIELLEEGFHHLRENAVEFQHQIQLRSQEVLNELQKTVNQQVARNSRVQRMILQQQPFEKTPTLKIKRFLYT